MGSILFQIGGKLVITGLKLYQPGKVVVPVSLSKHQKTVKTQIKSIINHYSNNYIGYICNVIKLITSQILFEMPRNNKED